MNETKVIPEVKTFVSNKRQYKTRTFYCPFCKTWHSHGDMVGHRTSHCHKGNNGLGSNYEVVSYTLAELRDIKDMAENEIKERTEVKANERAGKLSEGLQQTT